MLQFLIAVHGKDFKIAEIVATIVTVPVAFPVKPGGFGQPKLQIVRVELDLSVLDREGLVRKLDFLDWPNQVGFQPQHLIRGRIDPGAPLERHGIVVAVDFIIADTIRTVLALFKANLPSGTSVPLTQPFACELEVRHQSEDER
jgi:hypothetical protein